MTRDMTPAQAAASGYCIISRKAPTWAARIDRKDWREAMAAARLRTAWEMLDPSTPR